MKQNNKQKILKGVLQSIASVSVTFACLTVLIACGGNKGGGAAAPAATTTSNTTQPVFQQCANCQLINGPVFYTGTAVDLTGKIELTQWTFSGQLLVYPQGTNQPLPGQPGAPVGSATGAMNTLNYRGLVASNAQMNIKETMTIGYCQVPAGAYSVATLQAGQWSMEIVNGLVLQAINGTAQLVVGFTGYSYNPNMYQFDPNGNLIIQTTGRLYGTLNFVSFNGQACQQAVTVQ